jgi:hypothetical protein
MVFVVKSGEGIGIRRIELSRGILDKRMHVPAVSVRIVITLSILGAEEIIGTHRKLLSSVSFEIAQRLIAVALSYWFT